MKSVRMLFALDAHTILSIGSPIFLARYAAKILPKKTFLKTFIQHLFGEPDLIIRTGGELRLSNFMLYQGAYSELYFTDVLWPDFNEEEFDKAILSFGERKRRYGKI